MPHTSNHILSTLAYFDLFDYPLTENEICLYLPEKCLPKDISMILRELVLDGAVYFFDNVYSLQNNPTLAERRRKGNLEAKSLMKIAKRVSTVLMWFPFVRGVAVSGSLSKNFADERSDIDFFIITAKNRLWIARTILHLFKKPLLPFKIRNWFCMNYFIDEAKLEIVEKNQFTATEIVTLIPLQGDVVVGEFYAANLWVREYFPNNLMRVDTAKSNKGVWVKKLVEAILNNPWSEKWESKLMQITSGRYQKKTELGKLNGRGVIMSLAADKHVAKPGPSQFQEKFLEKYRNKVQKLVNEYSFEQVSIKYHPK